MGLRTRVAWLVAALGIVTVMASGSLVLLTSWLSHATNVLGDAMESARVAETSVQVLLLREHAQDPVVRADLASRLDRNLLVARQFVTSSEEASVLREAETSVTAYLSDTTDDPLVYERAFSRLRELASINVQQADQVLRETDRIDRLATVIGVFCAVAVPFTLVVTTGVVEGWLRPVVELAEVMQRFTAGDREARAAAAGPAEIREVATHFNELAVTVARHQEAQLAFLAGVAHDLRNPLMALRLGVASARRSTGDPKVLLDVIGRQVDHLEHMLGDLLDVARIQAGRLDLELGEHDLRSVAHDVTELFAAAREIRLHAPEEPLLACFDPARVHQVVTNLVSNAIKYSPEDAPVDVTVARRGDHATVSVRDRGIGLTESDREGLFEPFWRGRRAAGAPSIAGTGIGLFVARRIVQGHGGRITVESTPGEGSTFCVELPLPGPA